MTQRIKYALLSWLGAGLIIGTAYCAIQAAVLVMGAV